METTAFDYNLNRYAEIIASETKYSIDKARKLIKAGIYFGLGDVDDIAKRIIEIENI